MLKGTYNSAGEFEQQRVRLSRTESGRTGLFTRGMMAWPLDRTDYDYLSTHNDALIKLVTRLGFALE